MSNWRRENDRAEAAVNQLQSKASEADRLAALLNFRQAQHNVPMLAGSRDRHKRRHGEPTIYWTAANGMGFGATWANHAGWRGGQSGRIVSRHAQVLLLTTGKARGAMLSDSRIQSR